MIDPIKWELYQGNDNLLSEQIYRARVPGGWLYKYTPKNNIGEQITWLVPEAKKDG